MEPIVKPAPVPIPNRRKTVRRYEDIQTIQHTDAVDALLLDVAYDVRSILTIVHPLMEELRTEISKIEETSVPERQAFRQQWTDGLEFLSNHVKRLIDRMKQVRALAQASKCPLNTLIDGILKDWGSFAEKKGVTIRYQGLQNLPSVLAYEWRLRTVFSSVIMRALQVTQPGGSITISGRVDRAHGTVSIEVTDTGPGISLKLCDDFNSGKELNVEEVTASNAWDTFGFQQGRRIADIHGGSFFIESSETGGTRCSINFPIS